MIMASLEEGEGGEGKYGARKKGRGADGEREREETRREADSSHIRLDSRRQNVNLALTHYARSGCIALGVRYRQQRPSTRAIALMRVGRVADDAREEGRRSYFVQMRCESRGEGDRKKTSTN